MSTIGQTYVRGIIPDRANRQRDDFYPTPPEGTQALLSVERFEGSIWEPACGDGAISEVLRAAGYEVHSTDLIDRGYGDPGVDFLLDWTTRADNIVTNPPFKLAQEFIEHALRQADRKVAMLLRLAFLEGGARRKMYETTPLAHVWVFSRRLAIMRNGEPFKNGSGGMVALAWFVWDHAHDGPPQLGWI